MYYYVQQSSHYHLLPQLGTLHLTLHVYLRLANRPSAQFGELLARLILMPGLQES